MTLNQFYSLQDQGSTVTSQTELTIIRECASNMDIIQLFKGTVHQYQSQSSTSKHNHCDVLHIIQQVLSTSQRAWPAEEAFPHKMVKVVNKS